MTTVERTLSLPIQPPLQAEGRVIAIQPDGTVLVECEGRGRYCQRAASCLLTPEPGDSVLVASTGQQLWLLAILLRAEKQHPAQLSTDGDLHITAAGCVNLSSRQFKLTAEEGDCHVGNMNYSGDSFNAWLSLSRIVGKQCETIWQNLTQISHRLLRKTTDCEQVRAGQLDIKTAQFTRLHSRTTLISSETLTKVDAQQIHMG